MPRRLIVPIFPRLPISGFLKLALATAIVACGGGDSPTGPSTPPPTPEQLLIQIVSGDGQTARIGSPVGSAPTIRVLRAGGSGVSGVSVTFSVALGGGSVTASTVATNSSGEASTGWTLGSSVGQNQVRVTASGVPGSLTFSATARLPYWTVMVYLAADNNLAPQGFIDLEELEWAGFDPEIQVVVQGEFSPFYMLLNGLTLEVQRLSSWDTFRYALGDNPLVLGIDGSVEDLGSVDMTDPSTLRDFVSWATQRYPAERTVLIPWNHGGGYAGLIQDLTNRGSALMSIGEFRQALTGLTPVDIIDFDMCLMGGYETLLSVQGLSEVAIFSEEVVPGDGNPYHHIIDALQANPTASTDDVARMFVDEYSDEYLGERSSTTKSAYRLDRLDALDAALTTLAAVIGSKLETLRSTLVSVLSESQKYTYRELTDIGDFAGRLRAASGDPQIAGATDAVLAAVGDPAFRLSYRNYSAPEDSDVSASTGLHVVFPSGEGEDSFQDQGNRSFSAYNAEYAASPWGTLLAAWAATIDETPTVDLGFGQALEIYEVWDQATVDVGADIDFWLWEPVQRLFVPWYGTVTPNGLFSSDSYDSEPSTFYEGWLSRQIVEQGSYKIYAHLWTGPEGHQASLDVAFRTSASDEFTSLYEDAPRRLDFTRPIDDDPTASLAEAAAGAYSDFQWVAVWDVQPDAAPQLITPQTAMVAPPRSLLVDPSGTDIRGLLRKKRDQGSRDAMRAPKPNPSGDGLLLERFRPPR